MQGFFYTALPYNTASRYVDAAYEDIRRVVSLFEHAQDRIASDNAQWRTIDKDKESSLYSVRVKMPDMESSSISASLAPDGRTLTVSGKRKMEGCTCTETALRDVLLPYRPRSEDIGISLDAEKSELMITLAKDSKGAAVPIRVNVKDPAVAKESVEEDGAPKEVQSTAVAPDELSLAEKEKTLTEKFRAAGAAATLAAKVGSVDEASKAQAEA